MKQFFSAGLLALLLLSCGKSDEQTDSEPRLQLPVTLMEDYASNQRELVLIEDRSLNYQELHEDGGLIEQTIIDLEGRIMSSIRFNPIDYTVLYNRAIAKGDDRYKRPYDMSFELCAGRWSGLPNIEGRQDVIIKVVKIGSAPSRISVELYPGPEFEMSTNLLNGGLIGEQPNNQFYERHLSHAWYETITEPNQVPRKHLVIYTPINRAVYPAPIDFDLTIDGYVINRYDLGPVQ